MLISNFNLCKSEWLELVFAKRNKEYGAYYIRQHYADYVVKAMGITFLSITGAAIITGMAIRVKPVTERIIEINTNTLYKIPPVQPKAEPKKPKTAAAKPTAPVNTIKYTQMVVVPNPPAAEPPKIADLAKAEIGPVDIKVPGGEGTVHDPNAAGKGGGGAGIGGDADSKEVVLAPDVMPEPFGGAAGWAKFLQNNLRYPHEALDREMSGRVYVSFIVEKDGHLSSITVDRGAGFGMDEEAARVLKIAHAWKPGLQGGKPVRVKYTLPVIFSLGE